MNQPGYEQLAAVLTAAFEQAANGKGKERHANSLPFHEQPMQKIASRYGVGFILGQAAKKSEEAFGMLNRDEADKAIHELLGAIVYTAGAVIAIQNARAATPYPDSHLDLQDEPIVEGWPQTWDDAPDWALAVIQETDGGYTWVGERQAMRFGSGLRVPLDGIDMHFIEASRLGKSVGIGSRDGALVVEEIARFDEERIDRIAASHGDGEHYEAIAPRT